VHAALVVVHFFAAFHLFTEYISLEYLGRFTTTCRHGLNEILFFLLPLALRDLK
jgi:hypothetical protein